MEGLKECVYVKHHELEWQMSPPPPGTVTLRHTHALNKSVCSTWRLRLHEAVRMLCMVLDNVMWGSMARLNFDVTSDAENYQGIFEHARS